PFRATAHIRRTYGSSETGHGRADQGTRGPEHAVQWHRARRHDSLATGRHRERTAPGATGTRCRWLDERGRGCPLDVGEPPRANATEVRLRPLAPCHPRIRPVRTSPHDT